MAENFRKPLNTNEAIPFSFEAGGQTYSGTLTPSGKPPAFGMPNAFVVRMPGSPLMNISIYMGKWIIHGRDEFAKSLSEWIINYYK